MKSGKSQFCLLIALGILLLCADGAAHAVPWYSHGPDGGDARAFAPDPHNPAHLYLGTTTGWLYETHNGGKTWSRGASRVGERDDLVLDNILVDPADAKHLVVGAYVPSLTDGGVYITHDGGVTWTSNPELKGEPVLAMAAAPSNSKMLVAGTLKGIYRSMDDGVHWKLISPAGSKEIHEIESLAVDPRHPDTIYAGTWHLPWKTTDGGLHWQSIKQGIIDDSDVFSIILDPKKPSTVYLSACSGIYKSENAAASFVKMKGIPSDARRTRKLAQDPQHLETVFAGTTQGLYRTQDAGTQWHPLTDSSMIVNDVYVDPANSKHVLLATDHSGVMESEDGGQNFQASNNGFSARQILAMVADPHHPGTLYAGIINDKDSGGVFLSFDGGLTWTQDSFGLNGADVRSLAAAPDGSILAGTEHGIFRLSDGLWTASGRLESSQPGRSAAGNRRTPRAPRRAVAAHTTVASRASTQNGLYDTVYSMASTDDFVFAATSSSVLMSGNSGQSWRRVSNVPGGEWNYLAAAGSHVVAAQLKRLAISRDDGVSWKTAGIPADLTQVAAAAVDRSGVIWIGGREGLFFSSDDGASWHTLKDLGSKQANDIHDIYFDAANDRILVTGNRASTYGFAVRLADKKVTMLDTGWNLRLLRPVGDHLVAATLYDGMVIQPRMVASPLAAKW